jgi:hypothetical protein
MSETVVQEIVRQSGSAQPAPEHVDEGRPGGLRRFLKRLVRGIASGAGWVFGLIALVVGLSVLAALPLAQFLTLGYFLESSARVARSGRLRDGLIGVRRASHAGAAAVGMAVSMLPLWLVRSLADSAELIDPGGPVARGWRVALGILIVLTFLHLFTACARGGRLRYFLWPFGNPPWLARALRRGGLYAGARDALWDYVTSFRPWFYFRTGLIGFFGSLAWLVVPGILITSGGRFPVLGVLGAILLFVIVTFLPFLQVRYAVEGQARALFAPRAVRDRFRRAPWAFAFALLVLLLAAIPLYLLKIEMVPREAAWLPSLVFVAFLAPARLLTGWAYHRSARREQPRHWVFRTLGRLAIVPVAALYVLVVFLSQYTSWGGSASLFEQHAFLLPVPFLDMPR